MPRFSFLLSAVIVASVCMAMSASMAGPSFAQTTGSIERGPSGLPLPRFASLKAERVNMRVGPGKQYAVAWRYVRSGLPFEIIQEYDNWRRVRDSEGTVGWIHGSLLSGKRTAITAPWQRGAQSSGAATVVLHKSPEANSDVVAYLQPGVIGTIDTCDGAWCEMIVERNDRTIKGFANQVELWGAYPDESFD